MPNPRPKVEDLQPDVADDIKRWVRLVEIKESFGLWVWGEPRIGTSHAGLAALWELGRIDRFKGGQGHYRPIYDVYEDLKGLWDASRFLQGNSSDASAWAYRDDLDISMTELWAVPDPLMLNDWSETVPVEFFMRHFYPLIRRRISSGCPLIIVSRFDPSVTGAERQYFQEEFVVTHVTQRPDRDGTG